MPSGFNISSAHVLTAKPDQSLNASMDITAWGNLWVRFFAGLAGISQVWVGRVDEDSTVHWVANTPSSTGFHQFPKNTLENVIQFGRVHIYQDHDTLTSNGLFPLLEHNRLIGVVRLQSRQTDYFQPETINWLSNLMTGIAHSLSQEMYKTRERNLEFSIHNILQSTLNVEKTVPAALEIIVSILKADAGMVYSHHSTSGQFERIAFFGLSPMALEKLPGGIRPIHAGKPFSKESLPIWIEDLRNFSSTLPSKNKPGDAVLRSYLALPLIAHHELKGVLELYWKNPNTERISQSGFLDRVSEQLAFAIERSRILNDLQKNNQFLLSRYDVIIEGLSRALELRDLETEGHSQRVCELTMRLAKNMQIPREQWDDIRRGALLHDIGKIGIPDAVLLKPGSLTQQERRMMQLHVVYAYNILSPTATSRVTLDIIHYHHEHWDGNGYPDGLKGAQIPLAARLFSAVDVFDALTSDRPYRSAWSRDHAIKYLKEQAGTKFDPLVIKSFLDVAHN